MSQVSKTDCSSSIISANHTNFIFSFNKQYWISLIMLLSGMKCKYKRPICSSLLFSEPFLSTFTKLQKATISFIMSSCPSVWKNSTHTGRIFIKFDIWWAFKNLSWKFMFHYNLTRTMGTLCKDLHTFMTISWLILLRMRNVSEVAGTIKTYFCSIHPPPPKKKYLSWDNMKNVKPERPQMTKQYSVYV